MRKQIAGRVVEVLAIQARCTNCGWSHKPVILAHNEVLKSTGFYCLNCFENASLIGDFNRKEVL